MGGRLLLTYLLKSLFNHRLKASQGDSAGGGIRSYKNSLSFVYFSIDSSATFFTSMVLEESIFTFSVSLLKTLSFRLSRHSNIN